MLLSKIQSALIAENEKRFTSEGYPKAQGAKISRIARGNARRWTIDIMRMKYTPRVYVSAADIKNRKTLMEELAHHSPLFRFIETVGE